MSLTSSAAVDAQPELLDDLTWKKTKFDKRQAYCVSKACCVLFSDHLGASIFGMRLERGPSVSESTRARVLTDACAAEREAGKVLTAAVDPGPCVTQIVRYELPKRAKQREAMTPAQIERQAKQLGECTRGPASSDCILGCACGLFRSASCHSHHLSKCTRTRTQVTRKAPPATQATVLRSNPARLPSHRSSISPWRRGGCI